MKKKRIDPKTPIRVSEATWTWRVAGIAVADMRRILTHVSKPSMLVPAFCCSHRCNKAGLHDHEHRCVCERTGCTIKLMACAQSSAHIPKKVSLCSSFWCPQSFLEQLSDLLTGQQYWHDPMQRTSYRFRRRNHGHGCKRKKSLLCLLPMMEAFRCISEVFVCEKLKNPQLGELRFSVAEMSQSWIPFSVVEGRGITSQPGGRS